MTTRCFKGPAVWTMLLAAASATPPAVAQPAQSAQSAQSARSTLTSRLHANALESFRAGRFPEAYGRFISLAEAGHPASARYALWMCEHGLELFGKDWDCAPQEIEDWARVAGVTAPAIGPRYDAATSGTRATARR